MNSKYLNKFKRIKRSPLQGQFVLVEILPKMEIKTKAGLIIAPPINTMQMGTYRDQPLEFCIVLEVGPECEELQVGNVVLIPELSLKRFSAIPGLISYESDTIALSTEDSIQMVFETLKDRNDYFNILNEE